MTPIYTSNQPDIHEAILRGMEVAALSMVQDGGHCVHVADVVLNSLHTTKDANRFINLSCVHLNDLREPILDYEVVMEYSGLLPPDAAVILLKEFGLMASCYTGRGEAVVSVPMTHARAWFKDHRDDTVGMERALKEAIGARFGLRP